MMYIYIYRHHIEIAQYDLASVRVAIVVRWTVFCEVNRHLLKDLIAQGLWNEEKMGGN